MIALTTATRRAPASITSSMVSSPMPPMAKNGLEVTVATGATLAACRTGSSPTGGYAGLSEVAYTGPTVR